MEHGDLKQDYIDELIFQGLRDTDAIHTIVIDPYWVSRQDIQPVLSICDMIVVRKLQEFSAGRLAFDLTAYDNDFRDPVTIPEIRRYFTAIHHVFPVLPFFLDNDQTDTLTRYAAAICDVKYELGEITIDQDQLLSFLNEVSEHLISSCRTWNISVEGHIDRIWSSFGIETG